MAPPAAAAVAAPLRRHLDRGQPTTNAHYSAKNHGLTDRKSFFSVHAKSIGSLGQSRYPHSGAPLLSFLCCLYSMCNPCSLFNFLALSVRPACTIQQNCVVCTWPAAAAAANGVVMELRTAVITLSGAACSNAFGESQSFRTKIEG